MLKRSLIPPFPLPPGRGGEHPGGIWCHVRPLQPGRPPPLGRPGYWISSAANYLVGSVVSFFLNKHFTFRSREKGPGVVLRFAANITVCWLLAYGLAKPAMGALLSGTALSPQLQGNLTMLAGSGLFVLLNYFGQRFFAFRSRT